MAAFTKFQPFVENLAQGVFDFTSDATSTITVALSAPASTPVNTDNDISDITQIAYTNLSARVCTVSASAQTGGVYKLTLADLVLTASGAVAEFQFVTLYDDDAATDELIGFYDYGSGVTLADGDTFTIDFDDANGVLTIT